MSKKSQKSTRSFKKKAKLAKLRQAIEEYRQFINAVRVEQLSNGRYCIYNIDQVCLMTLVHCLREKMGITSALDISKYPNYISAADHLLKAFHDSPHTNTF